MFNLLQISMENEECSPKIEFTAYEKNNNFRQGIIQHFNFPLVSGKHNFQILSSLLYDFNFNNPHSHMLDQDFMK
jgi:hypothetical protein